MKAYIARDENGAVTSGWLLRKGTAIQPTMLRLRRTQREDVVAQETSVETVLRHATHHETEKAR